MVFDLTRLRLEPTIYHSVAILERYLDSIVTSNQQQNIYIINSIKNLYDVQGAVHGRDRMVVGFITTYAISAYHH